VTHTGVAVRAGSDRWRAVDSQPKDGRTTAGSPISSAGPHAKTRSQRPCRQGQR